MKIKLLFLIFLLPVGLIQAQSNRERDEALPSGEIYCMVLATQKFLSTKVSISIDFGQEQNFWRGGWRGERLRDEEGKIRNFNSVIDALNYMSNQGWLFVNAYAITVGQQNVYHYVLRRVLSDEEYEDMLNEMNSKNNSSHEND